MITTSISKLFADPLLMPLFEMVYLALLFMISEKWHGNDFFYDDIWRPRYYDWVLIYIVAYFFTVGWNAVLISTGIDFSILGGAYMAMCLPTLFAYLMLASILKLQFKGVLKTAFVGVFLLPSLVLIGYGIEALFGGETY